MTILQRLTTIAAALLTLGLIGAILETKVML